MALEQDVISRLQYDFCAADASVAMAELSASETSGRVARCIVVAANGSLERLRDLIARAKLDDRVVISYGEYGDIGGPRLRDLRVSFLIASPSDFWIGETAVTAHKHGYALTSLASQSASVGPFLCEADRGEGLADFSNGVHSLSVRKQNRQWSILPVCKELRRYGLDVPIDDEKRFRVQLDYYLWSLEVWPSVGDANR
jgi:hypothetical protein